MAIVVSNNTITEYQNDENIFVISRAYIGDYLRYLQHSGFSRIKIAPSSQTRKKSDNDKNIFFNKAKSRPRRSMGGGSSRTGGFVTSEDVEPVYVKKSVPGKWHVLLSCGLWSISRRYEISFILSIQYELSFKAHFVL